MTTIGYKADQKTIQELLNLYEKEHLNLSPDSSVPPSGLFAIAKN